MQFINPRRIGKMYHRFCAYIASIRAGQNSIMMGEGYVVLSMKYYEDLKRQKADITVHVSGGGGVAGVFDRGGFVVADYLPEPIDCVPMEAFTLRNLRMPEPVSRIPFERKTPAQRCKYSTKVK